MKIILHILLKDLRRHRLEIAAFMLACATWAWKQAHPWAWEWFRQREFVTILFFGLWFLVTVRVVQGESLVGDREFWSTRPYRWGQLMAAKALVLWLCLNIPFMAAQIYLLAQAEIPLSLRLLPGLIYAQLMFAFFFTFSAAVLAAITETVVQWVLTVAGLGIYALVLSWFPWDKLQAPLAGGEDISSWLAAAIVVPALAFALLWQYARRRVWPARLAVGAASLAIPLCILIAPTVLVKSIAYPRAPAANPFGISIHENRQEAKREYTRISDSISVTNIGIPIVADSLDENTIVSIDGYRVALKGDRGWHWESEWQSNAGKLTFEDPTSRISFSMSNKLADQMAQAHATAKVDLAYETYRLDRPIRIDTTSERFVLPGNVYCHWLGAVKNAMFEGMSLSFGEREVCAAPLHLPGVIRIRTDSANNTCTASEGEPPISQGRFATSLAFGNDMTPADFDPDPVHKLEIFMGFWLPPVPSVKNPKEDLRAGVCRGTPLMVSIGRSTGRTRASFDLGSIGEERAIILSESESPVPFIPKYR